MNNNHTCKKKPHSREYNIHHENEGEVFSTTNVVLGHCTVKKYIYIHSIYIIQAKEVSALFAAAGSVMGRLNKRM